MPFATTNIPPSTSPLAKVTVKIAGLLLLRPKGNECEIGVHRLSPIHLFQAILVVQKPGLPPTLIRLLTGPLTGPFSIMVDPAPATGFSAFAADSFDRSGSPTNHDKDYRWAVNLRERHPDATLNDGAFPAVTLNSGVLYTSTLSRTNQLELRRGTEVEPLYKAAADLAIAIDLPEGSFVKLSWTESGTTQHETLPRASDDPGTTYTISLMNDPPLASPAAHDELDLYYMVLDAGRGAAAGAIPAADRWKLVIPENPAGRTDEIPCLPITLHP
jgi:hypothetical protein